MPNNQDDLNRKLNYLNETKQEIKRSLKAKGQPVNDNTTFREYANLVNNITTGTDTDDADATTDDIINPKTAYVKGQKITGNIIPVYGISSLQTLGVVYSIDAIYDSFLFDYNIAVKLTSNGLVVANILSGSIEQSKTIDTSTLGIETIGTGAASFFPENVENDTIRLLIMNAPTNSGSRNYTAYVYKFNVKTFDIELLNSLEMTKIESSGRTIGRTWQEKIVWTDSSTCILPFLYASGPWYNFGDLTFRYFKLIINLDNNINLYVNKSISLGRAFGDVTGGTLAGVNSVTKVGNYVVVFTSKNYAGNSDYNWNYSSIFIDYTNDSISFISDGSDVGYVYHNSKVYGGNKIYNISNLQTSIGNITFNIPATKQVFIDQNYVVAYSGGSLHIYKFTDDETIEDEQSFNNFNSCNADSTFSNLYMYSSSNLQRLSVQKELNSLNKGGVFFRNSSTATVIPSDVLLNKVAYGKDGEFSGTMPNNGILNITPGVEDKTIPLGYTSGGTVKGDSNLLSENIVEGKTIFGVTGNATGSQLRLVQRNIEYPQESNIEINVYDSARNKIDLLGNNSYLINTNPIYIQIEQNGYKYDEQEKSITVNSYIDAQIPGLTNILTDDYQNSNLNLTGTINNQSPSYSSSGTLTFNTIKDYKGLYTNGGSYITYNLNTSIASYDVQFDFYKTNTASYSRVCLLQGPNYEIEIKGSSNAVYWGGELSGGWIQNEWNTLKLHKEGNSVQLYINNKLIATKTYSAAITGIRLGRGNDSGNYFTGYYKNVVITDNNKTPEQPIITITPIGDTIDIIPKDIEQQVAIPEGTIQANVSAINFITTDYYQQCFDISEEILGKEV